MKDRKGEKKTERQTEIEREF